MMFKDHVEYIAKLARIELSEAEKDRFANDLAEILEFFGKLKEVDVEGVEPMAQATGLHSIMRPDEAIKRGEESRAKLLVNAPEEKDGYIKVKTVFE